MRKIAGIVTLAAIGVIVTTPTALASEPKPVVRESTVTYGDLNLATQRGDQALISRISRAATKACGDFPYAWDLSAYQRFNQCRAAAERGAVQQVHNAGVTQLFDRKTGAKL